MPGPQIITAQKGRTGCITINRPEVLNAVNLQMCMTIKAAMDEWRDDPNIDLVMIDATGDKAFSVGGDINEIYQQGIAGNPAFSQQLWQQEYPFIANLSTYPKPYVSFMDGYVMGLGAGLSAHTSHRIVTERTRFAMPECSIGHIPDVGINALFAKAPGACGLYLGMTGTRIKAADCLYCDLADHYVPSERLTDLKQALIQTGDPEVIQTFSTQQESSTLEKTQSKIDRYFSLNSASEIFHALNNAKHDIWVMEQAHKLKQASPLSLACFYQLLHTVKQNPTVLNALNLEYYFSHRVVEHGDFLEGVRALIIDKDQRPDWVYKTIDEVSIDKVDKMLAPKHGIRLH